MFISILIKNQSVSFSNDYGFVQRGAWSLERKE